MRIKLLGILVLVIVLDGVIHSSPQIDEPIRSGKARIRGKFSNEEARNLSIVLQSGFLPAPLEIVGEKYVEPPPGK